VESNSKRILVTGGAGYIGSRVCSELKGAGFEPVTFDNLSTGQKSNVRWGPLQIGDLKKREDIEDIFEKYEFSGVIHLAAKAYIEESMKKPLEYFDSNVSGTSNLLSAAVKAGVNKFVFSSSCATYGEVTVSEISENQKQNPVNAYGFTKFACEKLLEFTAHSSNLKYGILRFFNAAGADLDCDLGEIHVPETHVIPLAINAALQNQTFKIFGNHHKTPDGTAIRDFIHINDLASAHVAAIKYLLANEKSFVCNLGSGVATSVQEIVDTIKVKFPDFKVEFCPARIGDPSHLVANIESAKKILGWEPRHSDIIEIINTSISWSLKTKI
jgi:UDP-glucose 4-epimerase